MWRTLRERLPGYQFRRQHPVARFIVDFAYPAKKLAIEIDGGQHTSRQELDGLRTAELARCGYRVIRFWNNEVMENLGGVLDTIRRELER